MLTTAHNFLGDGLALSLIILHLCVIIALSTYDSYMNQLDTTL